MPRLQTPRAAYPPAKRRQAPAVASAGGRTGPVSAMLGRWSAHSAHLAQSNGCAIPRRRRSFSCHSRFRCRPITTAAIATGAGCLERGRRALGAGSGRPRVVDQQHRAAVDRLCVATNFSGLNARGCDLGVERRSRRSWRSRVGPTSSPTIQRSGWRSSRSRSPDGTVVTSSNRSVPAALRHAALVLGEKPPQDRGEARTESAGDVAVQALVAGERVMKLLARDAVGDRGHRVEHEAGRESQA